MVVIAVHQLQLLRRGVDIPAHCLGGTEVKGRSGHRQLPPRGQAAGRCLQIRLRRQRQRMVHSRVAAVQIEITVVGKAAQGVGVTLRLILHPKRRARQAVGYRYGQRAGVALLSIAGYAVQTHAVLQQLRRPDMLVEALRTAVEVVLSVVFRQQVRLAFQCEGCPADAVAYAAHRRAEAAVMPLVFRQRVVSQHHVHTAEYQPPQRRAISKHLRCQKLIFQRPALCGLTARCHTERTTRFFHPRPLLSTASLLFGRISAAAVLAHRIRCSSSRSRYTAK